MAKSGDRHLIIDGYNVIHEVESLAAILQDSQEAACASLIQMARSIHDQEGHRVTIVFDGREEKLQLERPCKRVTFSVIYAPRQLSADGVIEQLVSRAQNPSQVTVATRDRMIREAAASRGAFYISGVDLETWVRRCEMATQRQIEQRATTGQEKWQSTMGDLLSQINLPKPPSDERKRKKRRSPDL